MRPLLCEGMLRGGREKVILPGRGCHAGAIACTLNPSLQSLFVKSYFR